MPIELGEPEIILIPAMYSSSAMKASEMRKVKKLRNMKTFVAHRVDRCLQYWNNDKISELIEMLDCQARFLPSYPISKSYRKLEAQAP